MPRVRTLNKKRRPPAGWELLEGTLEELGARMREAEREPHEGKRKCETLWPIFRIHHQRTRYVYEMYYKRKAISKELYEWCLREKYADKDLIAKWKRSGYERLCCLRCIQTQSTAFGSTCICRVPKKDLGEHKLIECVHCGCRGCASEASSKETGPRDGDAVSAQPPDSLGDAGVPQRPPPPPEEDIGDVVSAQSHVAPGDGDTGVPQRPPPPPEEEIVDAVSAQPPAAGDAGVSQKPPPPPEEEAVPERDGVSAEITAPLPPPAEDASDV